MKKVYPWLFAVTITLGAITFQAAYHSPRVRASDDFMEGKIAQGQQTFRFDTFGDEDFWGGALGLHQAIEGAANGGVGPGVSPATALAVGLKVDQDALPATLVKQIQAGQVNLNDPKTTLALLQLNAVVGVKGIFNSDGTLKSMGITCALCHSTVDNAFAPGIGHRRDGWANRDLNVGAIVALAPNLQPVADVLNKGGGALVGGSRIQVDPATVKVVLNSWGPGRFDAGLLMDGVPFRPDGGNASVLIPPAFGLLGVNKHTYEGWGSIPHWNAFVAVLEMHGKGNFHDSRLDDPVKFPVAAANGFADIHSDVDLVSDKLAGLQAYQQSIDSPNPPRGSFDRAAAQRGATVFAQAGCANCHVGQLGTDAGDNMHSASEVCIDDFQANRGPDGKYRTTPINGLWTHTQGGFYHDGRFPTLGALINHYDSCMSLGLSDQNKSDLAQYLLSR